jgi:hypothetical protein
MDLRLLAKLATFLMRKLEGSASRGAIRIERTAMSDNPESDRERLIGDLIDEYFAEYGSRR